MTLRRGEIYWVDFEHVKGSEQGGLRPALVVQQDLGNRNSPTTVVVALTGKIPPKPYPFIVVVEPEETGLEERSAINCSQMATIQQTGSRSRLRPALGEIEIRSIGQLSPGKLGAVNRALKYNLGLA